MNPRESRSEYQKVKAIMDAPEEPQDMVDAVAKHGITELRPRGEQMVTETPDGVTQAKQHLCQAANLYILCVRCVDKMIAPHVPPIAQTSEQFQAAVATLFIEASRMRFVDRMPNKPLK